MDEEGHIIHIDFSFMLSHSPGGISFEAAPFKLTRELLEVCWLSALRPLHTLSAYAQVMDSDAEGCASDAFNYFKVRALVTKPGAALSCALRRCSASKGFWRHASRLNRYCSLRR